MNDEQVKNELNKAAVGLNMDLSAIEQKFNEIREQHNMGPEQNVIAMQLFRPWHSQMRNSSGKENVERKSSGTDNHTVFGYVVAVDELRDFEE